MTRRLVACSNCVQGAADHYWWLVGAGLLIAAVLVVVLFVRVRRAKLRWHIVGVAAVLVLGGGVALSLSTLAHPTRAGAGPVFCSSALTAARTTGMPNDGALDPDQLACRRAGRQHLRGHLPADSAILAVGLVAAVVTIAGARNTRVVPKATGFV